VNPISNIICSTDLPALSKGPALALAKVSVATTLAASAPVLAGSTKGKIPFNSGLAGLLGSLQKRGPAAAPPVAKGLKFLWKIRYGL
jgi:hypothetical protein